MICSAYEAEEAAKKAAQQLWDKKAAEVLRLVEKRKRLGDFMQRFHDATDQRHFRVSTEIYRERDRKKAAKVKTVVVVGGFEGLSL